jgi:hypothetical protein
MAAYRAPFGYMLWISCLFYAGSIGMDGLILYVLTSAGVMIARGDKWED